MRLLQQDRTRRRTGLPTSSITSRSSPRHPWPVRWGRNSPWAAKRSSGGTLEGYRPHISHHPGKRAHAGDAVLLDRVALVDMAPGGKHSIRRILKLWRLAEAEDQAKSA